jgi:hypothetical protein
VWFPWRSKTSRESEKALKEATKSLEEAEERGQEVTAVAEALRAIRERNHFAEQLEAIILRRREGYR